MTDQRLPEGTDSILDENGVEAEIDQGVQNAGDPETELDDQDAVIGYLTIDEEDEGMETSEKAADGTNAGTDAQADANDFRSAFFGKFDALRGQATDRVFTLAQDGKDRATAALDDIARTVEDAAGEIDSRIGTQYGDYARRAAESIGGFSESFKGKDVDTLFADARDLVKKSPAVAIGAAAALGFIVARLVKAGVPETGDADKTPPNGRAG